MSNEELAVLAQQADREAIAALWEQVKRLLYQLARRFHLRYGADCCARRGVTMADLEQESFFALLDTVKAYKPNGEYQFTTYLTKASKNRFRACMGLRKHNPLDRADSLSAPAPGDGGSLVEVGDLVPNLQAAEELESIDTTAERESYHTALEAGMAGLPPIQSAVLRCRFYSRQTRAQVAQTLNITLSAARWEEEKALQSLRRSRQIRSIDYETSAYRGTGWAAWYYGGGSVEERSAEGL